MTNPTLFPVGTQPPLGEVPEKMHAWLIRPERFGEPTKAFQKEVVDVPTIADDEVLVYVQAAGVNYNNVWAALGVPVNVIGARNKAGEPEPFHIGGSDASGIVYKVGKNVKHLKVGDEVVTHCGTWKEDDPFVQRGEDPMYAPSFRIWGYETNYGSFAQFTRVQAHQCLPKPKHLTWEQAAAYMLVGATAYRMLHGWAPNQVKKDDVVLVWGGAGGLGSMAIQIARAKGAIPIAVISSGSKAEYCMSLGARGCINRNDFDHWGMLPHWKDKVGYAKWMEGTRKFGKAIWDILGEKRGVNIVFEHPGETTIPTSIFVCETGGMVAICAGTTGYNATVDLRYLWMRQKRLQGSHFANDEQSKGLNDLVLEGLVDPCLSKTYTYDELATPHQLMYENKHPNGNMSILIGAPTTGLGKTADIPRQVAGMMLPPEDERVRASYGAPMTRKAPTPLDLPIDALVVSDRTRVRELMHRGMITCRRDATVEAAGKLLVDHDINAVVVVDEQDVPVGVLSQTDLVLARQGRELEALKQSPVTKFMTPGAVSVDIDSLLSDAVTTMTRQRIHRVVVVEQGKAVGVLSMTDVVRNMLKE